MIVQDWKPKYFPEYYFDTVYRYESIKKFLHYIFTLKFSVFYANASRYKYIYNYCWRVIIQILKLINYRLWIEREKERTLTFLHTL